MLRRQIIFVFFFLFAFLGFFELIKIYKQSFQSKQARDRGIESSTATTVKTNLQDQKKPHIIFKDNSIKIFDQFTDPSWQDTSGKNKLTMLLIHKDSLNQNYGLGPGLDQLDINVLSDALTNFKKVSIPGINEKNIQNLKLGNRNFLRIYPGLAEGCNCTTISYVTLIDEWILQFTAHVTTVPNKSDSISVQINKLYGDIENTIANIKILKNP